MAGPTSSHHQCTAPGALTLTGSATDPVPSQIKALLTVSVAKREDPGLARESGGSHQPGGRPWVFT